MFDGIFTGSERICPYCGQPVCVSGVAVGVYELHVECAVAFDADLARFESGLTTCGLVPQGIVTGVMVTPECVIEGNSPSEVF